jgi:hypothetical protein
VNNPVLVERRLALIAIVAGPADQFDRVGCMALIQYRSDTKEPDRPVFVEEPG